MKEEIGTSNSKIRCVRTLKEIETEELMGKAHQNPPVIWSADTGILMGNYWPSGACGLNREARRKYTTNKRMLQGKGR